MWWDQSIPNGWRKVDKEEFEHAIAQENFISDLYMGHRRYNLRGLWKKKLIAIETDDAFYLPPYDFMAQV